MFIRAIEQAITKHTEGKSPKILFIWGPRRSGKTTLLQKLATERKLPIFNFDFISDQEQFRPDRNKLEAIAKEHKIILIDEVQSYPESTLALKLLHDEYGVTVIATGSSELRKKSQDFDSLAGRYEEAYCLPFSIEEVSQNTPHKSYDTANLYEKIQNNLQIFGAYPEVYTSVEAEEYKIEMLNKIIESGVLKDIIELYELKNTKLAKDILTKIALQLGQEVSLREIASSLKPMLLPSQIILRFYQKLYFDCTSFV